MELHVEDWKEFYIGDIFQTNIAKSFDYGNTEKGNNIFVGRTSNNNGVQGYVAEEPVEKGNCIIIGMVGENWAFYQPKAFVASQNIFVLRSEHLNNTNALFLCSILNKCVEIYRETYSLALSKEKMNKRVIKLPVKQNKDGNPIIDENKTYSNEGYIPDWQFMEDYIRSLHHKPITTEVKAGNVKELNVDNWEEFTINRLFDIYTGGDLIMSELEAGSIPVASNSCENNNIAFCTTKIPGRKLFNHNISISIADRGCFRAFIQPKDFYIATRVKALVIKDTIDITLKQLCFIVSVINQESFKFSYGRNCCANLPYIKIKLPVMLNPDGAPVLDKNRTYSDKGYIPDWQFMEDYINSLPYSDRL